MVNEMKSLTNNPAALNPGFLMASDTRISPVNVYHSGPSPKNLNDPSPMVTVVQISVFLN